MLKIKDSVDLKELEKFGFIKNKNRFVEEILYCKDFLVVDKNKEIFISSGVDEIYGNNELLTLYDLIQAGLVEKVSD